MMVDLALAAQVLVWALVCSTLVVSRQGSIYHPLTLYLAFHGLVFVVRPLLVYYLGFDAMWNYIGFKPTEQEIIKALEVSSFALLAFAIATIALGWTRTDFFAGTVLPFTRSQIFGLLIVTAFCVPLIAFSIKSSVSGEVTGTSLGGTFIMTGATGYTAEAQYLAGPLICAWLAVMRFRSKTLLLLVPYLFYRSYAGWSRWTLLLLFLSVALIYSWRKRTKWPPAWAFVGALPLLMLFHALGQNREYFQQLLRGEEYRRRVEHPGAALIEKWRLKYDGPDFANFDFLTFITAVVPERSGMYTYGSQYLQLFTEPIPRKLWAEKPVGAPVRSFNLNQYGNFLGMTLTLPGDGWMSGGWIGLAITMSTVGGALGLLHRWFWRNSGDNMKCLFYLVGLAMLPQWYRDGGISIAKFIFWNLSPLALWVFVTWLLEGAMVPVEVAKFPKGTSLRLLRPAPIGEGANPNQEKALS